MAILIPRVRTIGVRLREDEYSLLERFCIESGAHSIADVARSAISAYIRDKNRKSVLISNANRSSSQMKDLETKVAQLTAEIAQLKTATALPAAPAGESCPTASDKLTLWGNAVVPKAPRNNRSRNGRRVS